MRIVDLNPKWVTLNGWASDSAFYVGISFNCPCSKCIVSKCPTCDHENKPKRLSVSFWPPIDPDNVAATFMTPLPDNGGHRRTGDDFTNLTLSPSIGFDSIGHWHGHFINGEVLTA
jgi:hypothetical protein